MRAPTLYSPITRLHSSTLYKWVTRLRAPKLYNWMTYLPCWCAQVERCTPACSLRANGHHSDRVGVCVCCVEPTCEAYVPSVVLTIDEEGGEYAKILAPPRAQLDRVRSSGLSNFASTSIRLERTLYRGVSMPSIEHVCWCRVPRVTVPSTCGMPSVRLAVRIGDARGGNYAKNFWPPSCTVSIGRGCAPSPT